jgi:hypothetical protein
VRWLHPSFEYLLSECVDHPANCQCDRCGFFSRNEFFVFQWSAPPSLLSTFNVARQRGAVIQGRIIQTQHSFRKPRQFTIAIQLENFKWSGISAPLYASVVPSMSKGIFLSPFGQSPLVAAFPFTTDKSRYRVPAGYESKWIMVKRTEEEPASRGRRSELLRWNRSDPHAAIATERQPGAGN